MSGTDGITTNNGDVTLTTGGSLGIGKKIDAGTGTVGLTSTNGGITQANLAPATAAKLKLAAASSVTMPALNSPKKLAGRVTFSGGKFVMTTVDDVDLDTVSGTDGVTTNNGDVTLTSGGSLGLGKKIDAGTATVRIDGRNGINQSTGAPITGGALALKSLSGHVKVAGSLNTPPTVAAELDGDDKDLVYGGSGPDEVTVAPIPASGTFPSVSGAKGKGNITVSAPGGVKIDAELTAGKTARLQATDNGKKVTQTVGGKVKTPTVGVSTVGGEVDLDKADNEIGTVAAGTGGIPAPVKVGSAIPTKTGNVTALNDGLITWPAKVGLTSAGAPMKLVAKGPGRPADPKTVTVTPAAPVDAGAGEVELEAEDEVDVPAGATVTAGGGVKITTGSPTKGGTVRLKGQLAGAGMVDLRGGPKRDTFEVAVMGGPPAKMSGGPGSDTYSMKGKTGTGGPAVITEDGACADGDTLDVSGSTVATTIDLTSTAPQQVTPDAQVQLSSANAVENAVGTGRSDTIRANSCSESEITVPASPPSGGAVTVGTAPGGGLTVAGPDGTSTITGLSRAVVAGGTGADSFTANGLSDIPITFSGGDGEDSVSFDGGCTPVTTLANGFQPSGGAAITTDVETTTIANALKLAQTNYPVEESGAGQPIGVTRIAGNQPVAARLVTSDGSATAPTDYGALDVPVALDGDTFSASLGVISDNLAEPAETVGVRLTDASGGSNLCEPATGTITIAPSIRVAPLLQTSLGAFPKAAKVGRPVALTPVIANAGNAPSPPTKATVTFDAKRALVAQPPAGCARVKMGLDCAAGALGQGAAKTYPLQSCPSPRGR